MSTVPHYNVIRWFTHNVTQLLKIKSLIVRDVLYSLGKITAKQSFFKYLLNIKLPGQSKHLKIPPIKLSPIKLSSTAVCLFAQMYGLKYPCKGGLYEFAVSPSLPHLHTNANIWYLASLWTKSKGTLDLNDIPLGLLLGCFVSVSHKLPFLVLIYFMFHRTIMHSLEGLKL